MDLRYLPICFIKNNDTGKNMKTHNKSKIANALRKAIAVSAIAMAAVPVAYAEEAEDENMVTITGSRIKRTDVEGSLPVTTISSEFILSSGVTSVPDLMAQLPQMQGFLTASDTVGGTGGGVQTASLRDLGSSYTLVLLNGRRLASQDSGSSIDLNSIPLSAIERIEILTDGASALYGSDAIAGVVNFIMKSDVTDTTVSIRADKPQEEGGESWNFSISTGFGDLGADGYNIMVAYSHDDQSQLRSVDRDFASTGMIPFTYQGNELVFQRTSANAIPGNAYMAFDWNGDGIYDANGPDNEPFTGDGDEDFAPDEHSSSRSFNPYNASNGSCAPNNGLSGTTCVYDFTETLEIFPESERDNIFVSAIVDISSDIRFKSTLSFSTFKITPRIAPYPTDVFTLDNSLAIVQDNVFPHLTQEEIDASPRTQVRWRTRPGGNRTNLYETDTLNFVAGLEGDIDEMNWDVNLTVSDSSRTNTRVTGYPLTAELFSAFETGTVNIFDTPEALSDEANALIKSSMYSGPWTATDTKMNALEGSMSMPIFDMGGGQSYFAAGFDYRQVEYVRTRAQAVRDEVVLFEGEGDTPAFDLSRETFGVFGEMVFPISDELEVTASARYDRIGEITTTEEFGGASDKVGDSMNDTTFKVSMAYRPNEDWLIRASIGTGFKAPSMREIAEPLIPFGVTSSSYDCPAFPAGDPLIETCSSDRIQYDELRQGFEGLKPETSEQASIGFVYAPTQQFSFTFDWWQVNLEDQVARPTESQIFGDPATYRHLFSSVLNLGTGLQQLAIIRSPQNIGESNNEGFDWGMNITNEFSFGTLKTSFNGTYVMESESLVVGGESGEFETSLGVFGPDDAVTFRNVFSMNNSLAMGDFTHKLNMNYRSGYEDKYWAGGSNRIRLASDFSTSFSGGVQLRVPSYMTWDYQLAYRYDDSLDLSFGITNLLDKEPPLSLRASGAGHQVGYDPRYTDVFGRTFYVTAQYIF